MTRVRSSKSQRYLFSNCSSFIFLFFHIFLMTLLCFSFKEAFQMPFTTISRKILCEDLLPLFPLPSLPNASSMTRISTSISYYEVLTTEWSLLLIFNILFIFLFEFDVSVFKFYKSVVFLYSFCRIPPELLPHITPVNIKLLITYLFKYLTSLSQILKNAYA